VHAMRLPMHRKLLTALLFPCFLAGCANLNHTRKLSVAHVDAMRLPRYRYC
jgi:hypothetical protein